MTLAMRGMSYALFPVYAHYMTPADYGVLGVCNTIIQLLGTLSTLAIHGSLSRMYVTCTSERERRQIVGTTLYFIVVSAGSVALILECLGRMGSLDGIFKGISFHPYLQLTVWSAFSGVFVNIPATIYAAEEKPWKVTRITLFASLAQAGLTLTFVVGYRYGAYGALLGGLISNALVGVLAVGLSIRRASWRFSAERLKAALSFSVPLVPQMIGNWVLSVSDRMILERNVSASDLGRYSVGVQMGEMTGLALAPIEAAIRPMQMRQLQGGQLGDVKRGGTLAILAVDCAALAVALFAGELIQILLPDTFLPARVIAPWIALGVACRAHYIVTSTGIWYSMKTRGLPFGTLAAGALNVGLNLLLVPKFGILAAAVTTAVGYGALAAIVDRIAVRAYRIEWEYGRWLRIGIVCLVCFLICIPLQSLWMPFRIIGKLVVLGTALPVGLYLARAISRSEARQIRSILLTRLPKPLARFLGAGTG
jgi:O-antigen/teichoic acid export membrane protein